MIILPQIILAGLTILTPAVEADFQSRKTDLPAELFEVFGSPGLSKEESEALEFLYAYMPLPDIAGHDAGFHLENVKATLKARREMPWGESVPDLEFKHFVLPLRVNNEALDMSRPVMYDLLKEMVKGLSMKDAILEVNHWCHEYATYKPSDGRTSPPLSTMSQAIGRCGEESTFTVAALRAVGIPARQVYTPRWAHTDDNHAWVEAWADGQWYFLGACEPAPVLDMAWFNSPASRGMLMTTNVFGNYEGPEEKLVIEPLNTTINVTEKYAPVGELKVKVTDKEGRPVENAKVAFSLYNYAEFYPVAIKRSDADGHASLNSGLGDAVVWATDGDNFGWVKTNPTENSIAEIVLDKERTYTGTFEMTIVPPKGSGVLPSPSADLIAANDRRLAYEDSIRKSYEATFVSEEEARRIADELARGAEAEKINRILFEARGNSRRLAGLLSELEGDKRSAAISLLDAVTEKDRRDIPIEVVLDNIEDVTYTPGNGMYDRYVLSPRIDTEDLVPFRKKISEKLGQSLLGKFRNEPQSLAEWVKENVIVETKSNPMRVRMNPATVLEVMRADPVSRDIFFVAVARTAGIPSRIDPVTRKVQILNEGNMDWSDVVLDKSDATLLTESPKGHVRINYTPKGRLENPRYYSNFSISKIEGGLPHQLEYDEEYGLKEIMRDNQPLDDGQYMMISGQRMADGSVLARGEIFTITDGRDVEVPLIIRDDPEGVQVIGSLNAENLYTPLDESDPKSILSTTGRGYYVLGIISQGHEPSAHALNDLSAVASDLEKWGRQIVVLFPDADAAARFDKGHFKSLPSNLTFGIDTDGVSLNELCQSLNLPNSDLPVFVIADSFNRVVFATQGYTIGLGDKLLDTLSKIKE